MCGCLCAVGQVKLDSAGRDANYVKSITERSIKIVDGLNINDGNVRNNVLNIICNRYFKLNDIYDKNKIAMRLMPNCISIISSLRQI